MNATTLKTLGGALTAVAVYGALIAERYLAAHPVERVQALSLLALDQWTQAPLTGTIATVFDIYGLYAAGIGVTLVILGMVLGR